MQVAQERHGLKIDLGLGLEERLLLVADEGEVAELVGQIADGEDGDGLRLAFFGGRKALEEFVDVLAEVVERKVGEVRDHDPTRALLGLEVGDVIEGLTGCTAFFSRKVAASGFHLDDEFARPKQIYAPFALILAFDPVLKPRVHAATVSAENLEELVEKGFGLGFFALRAGPILGEGECPGTHLLAGEGHHGLLGGGRGHVVAEVVMEGDGEGEGKWGVGLFGLALGGGMGFFQRFHSRWFHI
jgi:hypothetical protein